MPDIIRAKKTTEEQLLDIIKIAIEEHGSLSKLAKAAGIAQPSLYRYVNDGRDLHWSTVAKVMDYLDLTIW